MIGAQGRVPRVPRRGTGRCRNCGCPPASAPRRRIERIERNHGDRTVLPPSVAPVGPKVHACEPRPGYTPCTGSRSGCHAQHSHFHLRPQPK